MVNSVGSNYTFAGTMMPNQMGKTPVQTTSTDGVQVRITPSNYRQVLGANSDVLLTPQNMKDMFDKGYLDVKKSRTVMESNEGTFTILAKAIGAIIGPSRSLGAITIDPNFMEMIKDPNAKIGAGYTRVSNETLEVLPSPKEDPPPPDAKVPMMPSIWPKQIQAEAPGKHDKKEYNPVEMTRVQLETAKANHPKIEVGTLGTYNHDKPSPLQVDAQGHIIDANHDGVLTEAESGIRPKSQAIVDALKSGSEEGVFDVSIQTNSNILRPDNRPDYNSNATDGLSQRRKQSASDLVGGNLKEASQNGDAKHAEILGNDFGLKVVSSQGGHKDKNGVVHFPKGAVMVAPKDTNNKQQVALAAATNDMIDTGRTGGGKGILQTNADILKDGKPNTTPEAQKQIARIDAIAEKVGKDKGLTQEQTQALKQEMYKVAQSFVDNRSFDAEVSVKDFDKAKKWVADHAKDPSISSSQIYKDVKAQVESQEATGSAAKDAVSAIEHNVNKLTQQPATALVAKEDIQTVRAQIKATMADANPAQKEQLQKFDAQLAALESKTPSVLTAKRDLLVQNLDAAAHPGTNIDAHDDQVLANQIKEVGGMKAVPPGPITIGGKTYNDPKAVDGSGKPIPPKNWESILADVHAVAKQDLIVPGDGQPVYDSAKVEANIKDNMGVLSGMIGEVAGGKRVNPESVQHFMDGIKADIAKLPDGQAKTDLQNQFEALTSKNTNPEVQKMMATVKAMGLAQDGQSAPSDGSNIGKSLADFHRYVKEVAADGQVDFAERDGMKGYVKSISANLAATLQSRGVKLSTAEGNDPERQLAMVTPEMLAAATKDGQPAFQGEELDQMVKNLNSVKSASAAINLCSEITYTNSLYQNVRQLDQKLNEFEQVGVVKSAFRGEMSKVASESPPVRFNTLMQVVYGLPPCPEKDDGSDVFKAYQSLQGQAKNGTLAMPPNVNFVDRSQLGGANGAYVRPQGKGDEGAMILLSRDLLDQPDKMMDVFTEEMFHHLEHNVSTQTLEASQRLDTADSKISAMIGPLNNAREEAGKNPAVTAALASNDMGALSKALKPDVERKVNAWLKDQMGPSLAKGKDGLAAAQSELTAKLVNCGVNQDVAKKSAEAMLKAPADGGPLQMGPISSADADRMVELMVDNASKPSKLVEGRGPSGALNGPNKPDERTAATLNLAMSTAKTERDHTREALRVLTTPGSKASMPELDAQGDEGRAGLYALKAISANRDMNFVKFEAERGRREELNVDNSGAIKKVNSPDAQTGDEIRDQGRAGRDIVVDGQVLVKAGTQMEFNSQPQGNRGTTAVGGNPTVSGTGSLNPYRSHVKNMDGPPSDMLQPNLDKLEQYQASLNASRPVDNMRVTQHFETARQQLGDANRDVTMKMNQLKGSEQDVKELIELQAIYGNLGRGVMPPAPPNVLQKWMDKGIAPDLESMAAAVDGRLQKLGGNPQNQALLKEITPALDGYRKQINQFAPMAADPKLNAAASAGVNAAAARERNQGFIPQTDLSQNFAPVAHNRGELQPNQTMQSAQYDEKKGTGSAIASMMLDVLPKGMQSAGQMLMQAAEGWQKQIKELYKSIIKPITKAEEAIYGGAGPWDNDVAIGRPQNYDELQTNKRLNQVTPSTGTPDYGKVQRENADRERQRKAAEEKKLNPYATPAKAQPQDVPEPLTNQAVTRTVTTTS